MSTHDYIYVAGNNIDWPARNKYMDIIKVPS